MDKAIEVCNTEAKVRKLKDACRTRWLYRIDLYVVFLELLPAVHSTLDAIVHPSVRQEFQLKSPPSFLIAFKILLRILYILRELTVKLQMQAIDFTYAYHQVSSVVSTLKKMREESSREFHLFTETIQLAQQLHGDQFELSTPRIVGWQVHGRSIQSRGVLSNHSFR